MSAEAPPIPTAAQWSVTPQGRVVVGGEAPAADAGAPLATGRVHTDLGYGWIDMNLRPEAFERVLDALDTRFPNHRWFVQR